MKILNIVEATTVNAVAKNVLDFHRSARELAPPAPAIEASIVTFDRPRPNGSDSGNEFALAVQEQGLELDLIPERRRFDTRVIPTLRKIIEHRQPDLVVTHSVKSHFLLWRSRLANRFPWVAFHHGYTNTDRKMRFYNRLDHWTLPVANRLVTVCGAFAKDLAATTSVPLQRISVRHNSIRLPTPPNAGEVAQVQSTLGLASGDRIILTVGRLSREKGHMDLVAALRQLREANSNIKLRLIVVGDGPERRPLESAVESSGLRDTITFTGQVKDVQPYYAIADVFVLPSHSEGSPNVLLEAMSERVPVVASGVGGVPEMVENEESALLTSARNPRALADAIGRVLTDGELASRLSAHAFAQVQTRYSPDKYARSLIQIYREVIDQYRIQ